MSVDENKTFTFKLFVFKNYKETEIRKFNLKKNDLCFEKMEEVLQAIFPNWNQSKFTLLWKDEVNDMITLSTSKEFSTFEEYILKLEDNAEIKLFINLEDEFFGIAQRNEQNGNVSFTCNTCQKIFTLKCIDCSTKTRSNLQPQERKILNIVDQSSGNEIYTCSAPEDRNEGNKLDAASTSNDSNINQKTSDQLKNHSGFTFGSQTLSFQSFSDKNKDGTTRKLASPRKAPLTPPTSQFGLPSNIFK